jgi:hypothetical protein
MSEDMHYRYDPKLGYVACSAAEAWDSEDKEKTMGLGNAYTPPEKKLLTDVGTRFLHVGDLLDYLNGGLIAVENSLERFENGKDRERKKRLEGAISLINVYRDQIANIDGHKWDLNNLLDKCVPERGVLEGIRKARIETAKAGDQKSLPPAPEDDNLQGV